MEPSLGLPVTYDPDEEPAPELVVHALRLHHEDGEIAWLFYGGRSQAEWILANVIAGNGWYHLPYTPAHPDWALIHGFVRDEPVSLGGYWAGRRVLRVLLVPWYNLEAAGYIAPEPTTDKGVN